MMTWHLEWLDGDEIHSEETDSAVKVKQFILKYGPPDVIELSIDGKLYLYT